MKITRAQLETLNYYHRNYPGLLEAALQRVPPPRGVHGLGDATDTTTSPDAWVTDITSILGAAAPVYSTYKAATTTTTPPATTAQTQALLSKYGVSTSSIVMLALGAAALIGVALVIKKKGKR